jgi:parvulin-like peptidyl-prolyl isomerase
MKIVSALVLLLGCSLPAAANDDPLVAEINGRSIRMSDVYAEIETQPIGDQIALRQRVELFAESLVREEILFQSALATDFAADPELREIVKSTVVKELIARHVTAKLQVSDGEVRDFYDNNHSAIRFEEIRAAQILLADRTECDALRQSISSDQQFQQLARDRSLHRESAELGGDLGLFMNHNGPLGFETLLFSMQPGDMAVFESNDGCHLVRVMTRNTPPLPALAEVKDRIHNLLLARKERKLLQQLLERAEKSVQVRRPE